jgi:hypothetical protein
VVGKRSQSGALIDLFTLVKAGGLTAALNGLPVVTVDAESRSLDVEAQGVKECGISLSTIVAPEGGRFSEIIGARSVARRLAKKGWTLTLYYKGSELMRMGSEVSVLTGHIRANPLKLRKVLDAL